MPGLIEHLEVRLIAALRFARVSNFDHQIDIRSIIVTILIRKRVSRIIDLGQFRAIKFYLTDLHFSRALPVFDHSLE